MDKMANKHIIPQYYPLMANNITQEDLNAVVEFLGNGPILTQSDQVEAFESEWSEWLGVKYSVFVKRTLKRARHTNILQVDKHPMTIQVSDG